MCKTKTLKELTISDNFLFGAVMSDEENCRLLLERVLGFPISRVSISKEYSMVYHPEYKGVRLDVYATDDKNTGYNIEMQAVKEEALGKRSRYYHSQMDMELLLKGRPYSDLPRSYVIFICDFDPFGEKKYCYTFRNICQETTDAELKDDSLTIFLSTKGINKEETPSELIKFLEFAGAGLEESTKDFEDDFVKRLQKSIQEVKISREMEARYMLLQEMLRKERTEGMAEGKSQERVSAIFELLQKHGFVPEELKQKILAEKDLDILRNWFTLAAKAETIEQFKENM